MPVDQPEDDIRRKDSTVPPEDLTLRNLLDGRITPEDVTIRRSMLQAQADQAQAEGYPQLARNFRRAAELTAIPATILLAVYEKLRPNRATYSELLSLSQELTARYDAPETGAYIREAAEIYQTKGLVKT